MQPPVLMVEQPDERSGAGRRFLLQFALVVAGLALVVAAVNRVAWRQMTQPGNQAIVQLMDGWGRVYKPILYDHFRPQVAVFGASWARDAFDPIATSRLTGLDWFNHGVSGATPYETRRFIESGMDNPRLQAVVLNLDTFLRAGRGAKTRYGFDEALLDTDPDGERTRGVGLRREFAITLSGAAIGNNLEVLAAIRARDAGAPLASYLDSYDRFDFAAAREEAARFARRWSGEDPPSGPAAAGEMQPLRDVGELERALETLCAQDLDVHAYFTPGLAMRPWGGGGPAALRLAFRLLGERAQDCRARLRLYNFNYPNEVTLDGIDGGLRDSEWFRSDGHPRPVVGLLMAARMLGLPFPEGTPPGIVADFGVELLGAADAEALLAEQIRGLERIEAAAQR